MPGILVAAGRPTRINTATTTQLSANPSILVGVIVASVSGGSFAVTDGGTTVQGALIPAATGYIPIGIQTNGALAIVTVGTIDITAVWTNP